MDSDWTARILSACSGVKTLTIWAIPSHRTLDTNQTHPTNAIRQIRGLHLSPQSSMLPTHHLYHLYCSLYDTLVNYVRPYHLAILIDNPLYTQRTPFPTQFDLAPVMSPDFSLGLFSNLTHLSIVNRWTEWCVWAWSWRPIPPQDETVALSSSLRFLPHLTHLSLDIQVGQRQISKTFTPPPSDSAPLQLNRNEKLAEHLGLPLATILTSHELNSHLRVLLCILSFDDDFHRTAQVIREYTEHHLSILGDGHHSQRASRSRDLNNSDPRLVFAYDGEPFREREAGSSKVWDMWRHAEKMVDLQRSDRGAATDGQWTPIRYSKCHFSCSGLSTDPFLFEL